MSHMMQVKKHNRVKITALMMAIVFAVVGIIAGCVSIAWSYFYVGYALLHAIPKALDSVIYTYNMQPHFFHSMRYHLHCYFAFLLMTSYPIILTLSLILSGYFLKKKALEKFLCAFFIPLVYVMAMHTTAEVWIR